MFRFLKKPDQSDKKTDFYVRAKSVVAFRRGLSICLIVTMMFSLCACGQEDLTSDDPVAKKAPVSVVFTAGFEKDEVFKIGTSVCKQDEFMLYLTNMQNAYETVYGDQIWNVDSSQGDLSSRLMDTTIDRIAQVKVMNMLAENYQVTLTKEEQNLVTTIAEEYFGSLNEVEKEKLGITKERVEEFYTEYAVAHKVYSFIIRDINPEISDDEARNVTVDWIYLKKGELVSGNDVQLSKARNYVNQIRLGDSFENIAIAASQDDVLTHSFGKEDVDEAIAEVAFSMAENEVSDIITTEDGYYILRCVSTFNREETDANKIKIVERRKNEAFNEVYGNFAEGQLRQVNDELWSEITLIHDPQVTTSSFFDLYDQNFGEE